MKRLSKIGLFLSVALFFSTISSAQAANSPWSDSDGTYIWSQSGQYNNGILTVKSLKNGAVLYDFSVMRGSEAEDSAVSYNFAGTMLAEDNKGAAELTINKKPVKLSFMRASDNVLVKQEGNLGVNMTGEYILNRGDKVEISEAGAIALIESLSPALTSLNKVNRPYQLEVVDEDDTTINLTAIHLPSKKTLATFQVAKDLSAAYRLDGEKKQTIY